MEVEIRHAFPAAQIALVQGEGGVFDVYVNGEPIYSKETLDGDQFPDDGEVVELIQELSAANNTP